MEVPPPIVIPKNAVEFLDDEFEVSEDQMGGCASAAGGAGGDDASVGVSPSAVAFEDMTLAEMLEDLIKRLTAEKEAWLHIASLARSDVDGSSGAGQPRVGEKRQRHAPVDAGSSVKLDGAGATPMPALAPMSDGANAGAAATPEADKGADAASHDFTQGAGDQRSNILENWTGSNPMQITNRYVDRTAYCAVYTCT